MSRRDLRYVNDARRWGWGMYRRRCCEARGQYASVASWDVYRSWSVE